MKKATKVLPAELQALRAVEAKQRKLKLQLDIVNHDGAAMIGRLMEKYGSFHGLNTTTGDIVWEAPKK